MVECCFYRKSAVGNLTHDPDLWRQVVVDPGQKVREMYLHVHR